MEDRNAEVQKRQSVWNSVQQNFEAREAVNREKSAMYEKHLKIWQKIVQYTTCVHTHGSQKPPGATWKDFWVQGLGAECAGAEFPMIFHQNEEVLPFCELLTKLMEHVGTLHTETKKFQSRTLKLSDRTRKRKQQHDRRLDRVQKKFQKTMGTDDEAKKEAMKKRRRQLYHIKRRDTLPKSKKRAGLKKVAEEHVAAPPDKPRRLIFISDKMRVVRFYQQLVKEKEAASKILAKQMSSCVTWSEREQLRDQKKDAKKICRRNLQDVCRRTFPDIVGKAQVRKWVLTAEIEGWADLPQQLQASSVSTSNGWRQKYGAKLKGRGGESGSVPMSIMRELDQLLMKHSQGYSEVSERREIVATAAGLVNDWNSCLEEMTEEIKNQNEQMLSKSHEAAMAGLTALPKPLKVPSASWCRMFQKNWGWSLLSAGSEAQAYLPYDHVDMVMSRNHVKDLFTTQGVHPGLLLNFDQVLTSSWSDGSKGPLAFCIPEGAMTAQEIQKWNQEHEVRHFIINSHSEMCQRFGLDINDESALCGFICDAWTGTYAESRGEAPRRNAFYTSHRVLPPRKQPGGWSSHGQPVDQLHGCFRREIRARDVAAAGMYSDLRTRPEFHELDVRPSGQLSYAVRSWGEILQLTLDAWNSLDPKVHQAAWLACGYMDPDHFRQFTSGDFTPLEMKEVKATLSDAFGDMGFSSSPQRCTQLEWQVQETGSKQLKGLLLCWSLSTIQRPCVVS
ncbi:unnamed protein product [Durusdinium trenchii]|uniref:Uncharacterized protein n=1 Tax=Durusdinium trenchii TaxID=1381693 RepID=A0ABP0SVG0_9DINO